MNIYKIILTFLNLRALKKENNAKINVSIHKCNEHNFDVSINYINLGQTESYTLYFIIWGGGSFSPPYIYCQVHCRSVGAASQSLETVCEESVAALI